MNKKIFILTITLLIIIGIIITFIILNNKKYNNNLNIKNTIEKEEIEDKQNNINNKIEQNLKINIKINEEILTATLINNSSTKALLEELSKGSITVDMHDYSNFEKVGDLGFSLPRNDENIETDYGDLILYQGNSLVIYYDKNVWNLTKLGKIDNITQDELKRILGSGDITITIFL